ncbi:hypothetical protein HXX76_001135 [Chlamydomonas incerta]|uniref:Uncharacterized protein n=1 Tax=Chlamydomonas incerta TaxID=51695 RepID=A0A835WBM7_CHLIN|nr:hypothetical protein HXX76_001135 [Chlamydomonas incerta]|eukprot:KAG2444379.1 hypothetical protein HXX76_001135 [Chlamydomonas incerta]
MDTGLQGRGPALAQTGAAAARHARPSRVSAAGFGPQLHWTRPWSFGIRNPALGVSAASTIASSGARADTWSRTNRSEALAKGTHTGHWGRGPASALDSVPAEVPQAPTVTLPEGRQPQPAHTLTTSPELLRRRHEQLAAAQDLTRQLSCASSVAEARELFAAHGERFNGIHWSALLTRLVHLDSGAAAPAHPRELQAATAAPIAPAAPRLVRLARTPTPAQRSELRELVSQQLLPCLGLSLMGLAPRQLASVLAALAALALPPPAFWMDEWLQHFGRRLEAVPPVAAPAAGLGGGSLEMAARNGGGGGREGLAAAAAVRPRSQLQPQRPNTCDIAQAMWSLARLRGMRPGSGGAADWGRGVEPLGPLDPSAASPDASAPGPVPSPQSDSSATSSSKSGSSTGGGGGGPSLVWLDSAAAAFATAAPVAAPRELSGYLAAAARLGYRPPSAAMAAVLGRCAALMQQELGFEGGATVAAGLAVHGRGEEAFGPRELSGVLWALAALGFNPGAAWLGLADRLLLRLAGGEEADGTEGRQAGAGAAGSAAAAAEAPAGCGVQVQQQPQEQLVVEVGGVAVPSGHDPKPAASTATSLHPAADQSDWWGEHFASSAAAAPAAPGTAAAVCLGVAPAAHAAAAPKAQSLPPRRRTSQPPRALLDARQAATCAWAFAKLSHLPPPAVMDALLRHTCGGSGDSRHAAASSSSGARGGVGGRGAGPGALVLRAARAQDLTMLAFALGVMRYRPEQSQQAAALLAAMAARMHTASDQDLVVWVAALSRLRLAVPAAWAAALVRHSAPRLDALPPVALVNWVAAMAELQTAAVAAPAQEAVATSQGDQGVRRLRRITKAKKEALFWAGKAAAAGAKQPQGRSGHDDQVAGPWVVLALPPRGSPSSGAAFSAGPAAAAAEPAAPSHDVTSSARNSANSTNGNGNGVVVRPAAALLRPVLLARLARLGAARLPELDLETTCRLAFAAARLRVRPGARGVGLAGDGGWVDALVASSMDKLERRLRAAQPHEQATEPGRGQRLPRGAGAAQAARSGSAIVSPAAPVVGAEWLLKLVWAVAALLRRHRAGLQRSALKRPLLAHLWRQRLKMRLQLRQAGLQVDKSALAALQPPKFRASGLAAPAAASGGTRRSSAVKASGQGRGQARQPEAGEEAAAASARPAALVRRRWCTLLMAALWPQLASLSNTQLLRLVNGMAALYESGGDGVDSSGSRFGSSSRGAADHSGASASSAAGVWQSPVATLPQRQRKMAAALHAYCRERVEATCGGEDACDVTTAGLLRVTSAWEAYRTIATAAKQ